MSILSDATHTKVGNELGFFIRMFNDLDDVGDGGASATIDGLDAYLTDAESIFDGDATGREFLSQIVGLNNKLYYTVQSMKVEVLQILRQWVWKRLAVELSSTGRKERDVLGDLAWAMRQDSKAVLACTGAVGSVTASSHNVGSAYEIKVDLLDPWGENNNNIQDQAFDVVCISDSVAGTRNEFDEQFTVTGDISGQITIKPVMYPGNDASYGNRLQNEDGTTPTGNDNADVTIPFENFTSNTPDGWTVDTGTPGTDVNLDTAVSYFGDNSLELTGDTGGTLLEIYQDANDFYGATSTAQKLTPGAHYAIGFWTQTTDTATGVVSFYMDGTGYTAGATEKATLTCAGTAASTWVHKTGVVEMPLAIPTDMKALLKTSTALANTKTANFDGLYLTRIYYWEDAGVGIYIVPGSTAAQTHDQRPDSWVFATTNNEAGKFNTFMGRRTNPVDPRVRQFADIQIALPTATAASSQYSETKAT